MTQEVVLGCLAEDLITGFRGIVIGKVEYLYGCSQVCLTPPAEDGKTRPSEWFDAGRVKWRGVGVNPADVQGDKPGGPNRDAPRR